MENWLFARLTYLVPILLSLSVHEWAHAWAAWKLGDDTAVRLGRMTLNPIAHIDPVGTLLLPLLGVPFGWAKPVPFNPMNLRDRRWGEIFIALAGPLSNVLLVILFVGLYKLLLGGYSSVLGDLSQPVHTMLRIGIQLNVILAVFNLIPIPPLDGSHILRNLLPESLAEMYAQIPEWMGFVVLLVLIWFGFTQMLTAPIYRLISVIL